MNTTKKISPNFYFHEYFSEGIWRAHDEAFLRKLIDHRLVTIMEKVRTELNEPVYINNWKWNGGSMYKGFRPLNSPIGALYSQHKFGRAADFQVRNYTVDQVRQYILDNESDFMNLGLTRLEDGRDAPTWVHLDLAWTGLDHLRVFRA